MKLVEIGANQRFRSLRIALAATVVLAAGLAALWAARGEEPQPAALASASRASAGVDLAFTAAFDPSLSHVDVHDGSGASVTAGRLRPAGPDRLHQRVRPTSGDLTVEYHMVFTDGAELTGTIRFGVPAADGLAEAPHQHGVDPVSAALLVVDGLVVAGAVILLIFRPRPKRPVDPAHPGLG